MIDYLALIFLVLIPILFLIFSKGRKFVIYSLLTAVGIGVASHIFLWAHLSSKGSLSTFVKRSSSWRSAIDGYDIESIQPGSLDHVRNPLIHIIKRLVKAQFTQLHPASLRIVSIDGAPIKNKAHLEEKWSPVPPEGVAHLRIMNPTPDNALSSIFVSPSFFSAQRQSDKFQPLYPIAKVSEYFGMDGLPVIFFNDKYLKEEVIFAVDNVKNLSPTQLQAHLHKRRENHEAITFHLHMGNFTFGMDYSFRALVRPRVILSPWISESFWEYSTIGLAGSAARVLANLGKISEVWEHWEYLPKQWYLLDDQPTTPFLMTKLSSVSFSFFFSLAFVLLCFEVLAVRKKKLILSEKRVSLTLFTATLVIIFQACDFFILRIISL